MDKNNIDYLYELEKTYSWIKVIDLPDSNPCEKNYNIHRFFRTCINEDTIYIGLDDDIVWLDKNFIKNLYQARIDYPDYFLVFPQIVNNGIIAHLQQKFNVFKYPDHIDYACLGNLWKEPSRAISLHEQFLDAIETSTIDQWRMCFDKWVVDDYDRVSINSFAFFGKKFREINVDPDEEHWLACVYPRFISMKNIIIGYPICVHYSFYTQKCSIDHHNSGSILQRYIQLANDEESK